MPFRAKKSTDREARFWNKDLQTQRTELRKLWKKKMANPEDPSLDSRYKKSCAKYQKSVSAAKKLSTGNVIETITEAKDMARFIKICQGQSRKTLGMLQRPDGTDTTTVKETLAHLMEVHFPGSVSTNEDWKVRHGIKRIPERKISKKFEEMISTKRVRAAFAKFGNDKAAGLDLIKPVVLKNLPESTIERVALIYRASLEVSTMLRDWLISKSIFVPKQGKEKYNIAKSYRPISLSSFILKGLERIVGWNLEETVMKLNPLSKWQHGFRTEKSTETAIIEVVNFIESAKLQGQFCIAILLDIQGAFDNVNAACARETLRERGFPEWFLEWYGDFLGNRYAKTELKGEICFANLKRGTPQGDVLSTLVWNVIYDPLLVEINKKTACKAVGFADDGIILVRGSVLDGILCESQKAIDIASRWGEKNGLTFNEAKTEVLLFTNKKKFQIPWNLTMNGKALNFSKEARYLGITLDSGLSWNSHLEKKIKDAKRKLMMVKNAITKIGAPSGKLLEWAYRGIIIPSLAYGATAWAKN